MKIIANYNISTEINERISNKRSKQQFEIASRNDS